MPEQKTNWRLEILNRGWTLRTTWEIQHSPQGVSCRIDAWDPIVGQNRGLRSERMISRVLIDLAHFDLLQQTEQLMLQEICLSLRGGEGAG